MLFRSLPPLTAPPFPPSAPLPTPSPAVCLRGSAGRAACSASTGAGTVYNKASATATAAATANALGLPLLLPLPRTCPCYCPGTAPRLLLPRACPSPAAALGLPLTCYCPGPCDVSHQQATSHACIQTWYSVCMHTGVVLRVHAYRRGTPSACMHACRHASLIHLRFMIPIPTPDDLGPSLPLMTWGHPYP